MKTKLFAILLLAGSSLFARTHVSIGIGFGGGYGYYAPPPAPFVTYYRPPCPGPGYIWGNGYWVESRPRYTWTTSYWVRPSYVRSYWVRPRYYGRRYYRGYWHR